MHLSRSVSKYAAITRINLQSNLAYVREVAFRSIFMLVILYVFIQLWTATYNTTGSSSISGMTLPDTIWYLVMTETIMLSRIRCSVKIAEEVKEGSLAYTLGRPYSYLLYQFFHGLGDTVLRMAINFVAGSILVTLLVGPMPATNLPAVLVTVLLAIILDFCFSSMLGFLGFVTEDVSSFDLIYQKILFILGGMMIPLDFMPEWLKSIALALPFNLMVYAPARLFVQFEWSSWLSVVAQQLMWIGLAALVLNWVFRWGIRRVAINGG